MKRSAASLVLCAVTLLGLVASPVVAVDYTIYPTSLQDGILWTGVGADGLTLGFGIWGFVNGANYVQAGIHTLPPITAADVGCAVLRIPETDTLWTGGGEAILSMDWFADHFDALDDTRLTNGDEIQPALDTLGLYRKAGPRAQSLGRYTQIVVTAALKADLNSGRGSFAWRLRPSQGPSPAQQNAQMYLPTVNAVGYGFPPENQGARLIIYGTCPFEGNCSNGVDDDGDLLIDCADSDCTDDSACPENCGDSIDNDADGAIDCADSECLGSPLCPETICGDGLDNDGDGKVDCADPDCTDSDSCPEICNNAVDDDADGDVDCADSECATFPEEPCHETACADGLDGDGDGLTDCADADCVSGLACAGQVMIQPSVSQDGPVYGGSAERNWPYGWWGNYGGTPMNEVGIHTLPPGIAPTEIGTAVLRLPRTDNPWQGNEALQLNMLVRHIDAANDVQIEVADKDSTPLGDIGVYRAPGPHVVDNARYIEFRVTDQVRLDLSAGRSTFAWRVEAESLPDNAYSYRYMPTVENQDIGAFGDNRGAKLFLYAPGVVEDDCEDGVDNDGDNLVDCADSDCSAEAACPEICNDGTDNDANGLVDCSDPDCTTSPACPEKLCGDGIDNDNDGFADCADSDCFGGFDCQREDANCGDGADNDLDCLIDGADPDCSGLAGILPTADQDAPIYGTAFVELGIPWGWWGSYDGGTMVMVGIHTLPAGATAGSVLEAKFRLPRHDLPWTADESALDMDMQVRHIDAANDAKVSAADKTSPPLADIGQYRAPGPYTQDNSRFVEFDVTAQVQADITAGRATFAWRIDTDSPIGPGQSSHRFFPTVDDQVTEPVANRSTLFVRISGGYESDCSDGVDNDADGRLDCADADCFNEASCNTNGEASCGDHVDNDGDGLVDCADTDCLFDTCCETPLENCANGADDDGDDAVDCADSDCYCAGNCGPWPAEACGNGRDDDCDGAADCADSECTAHPTCLDCPDPFADLDSDGDVDTVDFARWQRCVTAGGGAVASGCECLDRDGNHVIDVNDLDAFVFCSSGPSIAAQPSCDDPLAN